MSKTLKWSLYSCAGIVAAGFLYFVSRSNYLLFHQVIEMFSIIIACGIFMVAWHSRKFSKNSFLLFIGIAFTSVAVLDFVHTMTYKGMGIFQAAGSNAATQLWIQARYLEAFSMILAPVFLQKRLRPVLALCIYGALVASGLLSVFIIPVFPVCFIPRSGLTGFKIYSEFIIAGAFVCALVLLYLSRRRIEKNVFLLVAGSIILTIVSEIAFTFYKSDVYGFYNYLGHVLKAGAFFLLYRAVIADSLERPYATLFGELSASRNKLQDAHGNLEKIVTSRTRQLEKAKKMLELQQSRLKEDVAQRTRQIAIIARFPEEDPYPVMRIGSDGKLLYANTAAQPLVHQWKGKDGARVGPKWQQALAEAIDSGKNIGFEVQNDNRWFYLTAVPVSGEQYINIFGLDITRRKSMEDKLRHAGTILQKRVHDQSARIEDTQHILTNEIKERIQVEQQLDERRQALEAVYAMSTAFNSSISDMYDQIALSIASILKIPHVTVYQRGGRDAGLISQVHNHNLFHRGDRGVPFMLNKKLFGDKEVRQHKGSLREVIARSDGGGGIPFKSMVTVPLLDYNTNYLGLICATDTAERGFSEDEIHLIQIFARYIAHELSRRELEEKLRQANELKMLGQLTSGVAHEVRNPLNAIMAITEALFQDVGDDPEFDPYKHHIQTQVSRLSALMEDLLALGRPVRTEDFQSIPIDALINDALSSWRLSNEQNAEYPVSVEIPETVKPLTIGGHKTRLQQVFVNLLDNAVQHSPDNTPVAITVPRVEHQMVYISFVDRGNGFEEENLPRLFEPFFTTRKGGTGLGLSIVRHIIESHRGAIRAYNNTPPPGATIEVCLPLENSNAG
ncbi:MAG: GHKL domain-containing protein [Chitinivibrionales bacterium]|nr:GHKL domain-containing protein [Chitinivibrionales bacterium]